MLTELAEVSPDNPALLNEAWAAVREVEERRPWSAGTVVNELILQGYADRAFACIDELPREERQQVLITALISPEPNQDIPAWPEAALDRGIECAQRVAPWWSVSLLRRLAELHPARAHQFLNLAMDHAVRPIPGRPQERDGMLGSVASTAIELDELSVAQAASARMHNPADRLRTEIGITALEHPVRPVRALRALQAHAAQELADNPVGWAEFAAKLHEHTQGKKIVPSKAEQLAVEAIPDKFLQAKLLGTLAERRQDPALLRRAYAEIGALPPSRERMDLGLEVAQDYGLDAVLYAHPYVLERLYGVYGKEELENPVDNGHAYAEVLAQAGHPDEAAQFLPLLADDIFDQVHVAAATVRAKAAQGKRQYKAAESLAAQYPRKDYNKAALLIGSARYRSRNSIALTAAAIEFPATRAEALCEIALTTRDPSHLAPAAEAAQQNEFPHFVVDGLAHVIKVHRIIHGQTARPNHGSNWHMGVHRWVLPSRDRRLMF
jgi:hypothetical protein